VPYIIGNEAAERFSFYGMRSILIVFMTTYMVNKMGMPDRMGDAEARYWFSQFVSAVYFLPILGAILAEVFLGKVPDDPLPLDRLLRGSLRPRV
jgi:POT family proton-dependent oligopeptide transporter